MDEIERELRALVWKIWPSTDDMNHNEERIPGFAIARERPEGVIVLPTHTVHGTAVEKRTKDPQQEVVVARAAAFNYLFEMAEIFEPGTHLRWTRTPMIDIRREFDTDELRAVVGGRCRVDSVRTAPP